jgi:ClpP class serine protease
MSEESLKLDMKLCNIPLMVSMEALDGFVQEVSTYKELVVSELFSPPDRSPTYFEDTKLGIVEISGGIIDTYPYPWVTTHQAIREEVAQLISEGAKTILLEQDSGGGMAHMTFESANYIRNLADDNGVKIISYVTGKSHSASYAYSAAAHEIIASPSSEVGSIGVRIKLMNASKMYRNMGIEELYITAGEGKVPVDENGEFTQAFKDEMKASVVATYQDFKGHVGMWRGMEDSQIEALGAKTYSAKAALENGLIDKIMTLEELKSYLETETSNNKRKPIMNVLTSLLKTTPRKETAMSDTQVDVQAQLASLKEEMATQMAAFQAASEAKLAIEQAEKAELKAALEAVQKEKQEAKAAQRLSELSALFGDTEAPALNASLSSLDDVAFAAVVKTFEAKSHKKDSEMTKEVGEEGKVVVTEAAEYSSTVQKNMQEFLTKQANKKGAK